MELSPEIYAWLVTLNIYEIDPNLRVDKTQTVKLTSYMTEKLFEINSFAKMIVKIEEQYNKFYKVQLHYSSDLKFLHKGKTNSEYMKNWKILTDILMNYGIEIESDRINDIAVRKDVNVLSRIIKTLFLLSHELATKNIEVINKPEVKMKANGTLDLHEDLVDLESVNIYKDLRKTDSTLEFFLASLSKSLEMKPRQCAALLANNRKYLVQIAVKGIKGDYDKINRWISEVEMNEKHLIKLIKCSLQFESTRLMSYSTVSVGLFSKDEPLARNSLIIIERLDVDLGTDWQWLIKEGLTTFIEATHHHKHLIPRILNLIANMVKDRHADFFKEFNENFPHAKVFEFLFNTYEQFEQIENIRFKQYTIGFFVDYCFKNTNDRSMAYSILADFWIPFKDTLQDATCKMIMKTLKKGAKEKNHKNVQMAAITQLFRLMFDLGKIRSEYAPTIYKMLIQLFLEDYENNFAKEIYINNFMYIFKTDPTVPIDMLIQPYFELLKSSDTFDISDFNFIFFLDDHPKMTNNLIKELVPFYCRVSLENLPFTRIANNLIRSLFARPNILDEYLISYVKDFINLKIQKFTVNKENTILLEAPTNLLSLHIEFINKSVEEDIVLAVEKYRKDNGAHSQGLLQLLWYNSNYDEILLKSAEVYAEKYPKLPKKARGNEVLRKKQLKQKIKEAQRENKSVAGSEFSKRDVSKLSLTEQKAYEEEEKKLLAEAKRQEEQERKELLEALNAPSVRELNTQKKILENKVKFYEEKNKKRMQSMQLPKVDLAKIEKEMNMSQICEEGYSSNLIKEKDKDREAVKKVVLLNLEDEEDRDKRVIDLLIDEYSPELKYYWNAYITEPTNETMSRAAVIRMLRELGFNIKLFSVEDFHNLIRQYFGLPLMQFNYNQFIELTIQNASLAVGRINSSLSPGQRFQYFCRLLSIPTIKSKDDNVLRKVRDNYMKNPNIILPPGFKKKSKLKLGYEYKVPEKMIKVIGEKKAIVIELLDYIINKAIDSHILEPYLSNKKQIEIVQTFNDKTYKWRPEITLSYLTLNKSLAKFGIDAGNALEDVLRAVEEGKQNLTTRGPTLRELKEEKIYQEFIKEKTEKEKKRQLRIQFIEKKIKSEKTIKEKMTKQKEEELKKIKKEKEENLKQQLVKEKLVREGLKEQFEIAKKIKQEAKEKLDEQLNKKKLELKIKKERDNHEAMLDKRRQLQEQFKVIINKSYELRKEAFSVGIKLPKRKSLSPKEVREEKKYHEFEHKLNGKLNDILNRNDISKFFEKYNEHIDWLYNVFANGVTKKIGGFTEENLHLEGFKQFCSIFSIVGLLINVDQMNFIFKKLARFNGNSEYDSNFIRKEDFKVALLYLAIYSKYTSRTRKIMPDDLKKVDEQTLQLLFNYMKLELPFDRYDMEGLINDRKKLTAKQYQQVLRVYEQRKYKQFAPEELELKKKHYEISTKTGFIVPSRTPERTERTPQGKNNKTPKKLGSIASTTTNNNTRIPTDGKEEKKEVEKKEDTKNLSIVGPNGENEKWNLKEKDKDKATKDEKLSKEDKDKASKDEKKEEKKEVEKKEDTKKLNVVNNANNRKSVK